MNTASKIEKKLLAKLRLKHLSLLDEIDKQQNILKASKNLNMAQPAATKILQEIEDILGVTLFKRTSRGVTTTDYGKIMLKQAKLMLGDLRHATEEIASHKDGITGHVKVGTLLAAAPALLPRSVAALKKQRPDILISIRDGTNEDLLSTLYAGDLDMVISRLQPYPQQRNFIYETLYEESMCIVARSGHPKAKRKQIPLSELAEYQWVLPIPQTRLREQFDQAFINADVKPPTTKVIESVSLQTNIALLLESNMVTPLPFHAVKRYISLGLLVELNTDFNSIYGPIGITYKEQEELSPAAKLMLDCLKNEANKLGD